MTKFKAIRGMFRVSFRAAWQLLRGGKCATIWLSVPAPGTDDQHVEAGFLLRCGDIDTLKLLEGLGLAVDTLANTVTQRDKDAIPTKEKMH